MPTGIALEAVQPGQTKNDFRHGGVVSAGQQPLFATMADNGELAVMSSRIIATDAPRSSSSASSSSGSGSGSPSTVDGGGGGGLAQNEASSSGESVSKRSANMTETVRVPTSEHVAEIVGRQGCKIKALRAKTNTYIKTPARGEEPVFVVTGRPEDVAEVKQEILSAAEHFSQIRASRRNATPGDSLRFPTTSSNEQVREKVAVPFWVVGLVVGPKGTTIRRIQQETQTYIITPGKEKEPVFEIVGTTENVAKARQEIESYIAVRMRPRQSQMASVTGWTKLDNRLNDLTHPQHESLHSSSHLASSGCLFDPKVLKEFETRQSGQNERNWRHSSGLLNRPVSVDVGEFFRCFPTCENLSLEAKNNCLLNEHVKKPQLEIEAVLSNCLSDLNLMSHDILKSFINQDSSLSLVDLKPEKQPSTAGTSRMPFAMKSVPDDIIDYPLESITSFYTVGSHSQI